jgi:hypothetical protein
MRLIVCALTLILTIYYIDGLGRYIQYFLFHKIRVRHKIWLEYMQIGDIFSYH